MSVLERCPYYRVTCIREVSVLERYSYCKGVGITGVRIREVSVLESCLY